MASLIVEDTAQENLSGDNAAQGSFFEATLQWIKKECPDWNNEDIRKTPTYMIPHTFPDIQQNNKGQLTEKHVFDILQKFGDKTKQPMFVVHSHKFSELFQKLENGTVKNSCWLRGETDFVIIHRKVGVIFLQVKAADKTARAHRNAVEQLDKDQMALTCALKRLSISELDGRLRKGEQPGHQEPEKKTQDKKKCNKLQARVEKEMNKYPGFVVMPNCPGGKAKGFKGCFKEDLLTVEDFEKWWEKNIVLQTEAESERTEDQEFSQDIYEQMAVWFVGPRVLNESFLLKDVVDKTHKRLIKLTKDQLGIMTQDVPQQDIVGPAGSGKTWLLLEKAKEIAGKLKGNERILIMCFNKPLSLYLVTEFQNIPRNSKKVVIKTFVSILMEIKEEKIDLDALSKDEEKKLVFDCVQKLNAMQVNSDPKYKYEHVFVDEGQDMFGIWLELVELLHADSDEERRYRWVFFDNNQSVHFGSKYSIPRKIINNAKLMNTIVRNTANIFQCSQKFLSPTVGAKLDHGIVGLPVRWVDINSLPTNTHLPSSLSQLQKGAEVVKQEIIALDSELVARSDMVVLTKDNHETDELCSVFKNRHHILTQSAEKAVTSSDNIITVDSIRRFKGLERKVVILLDPPFDREGNVAMDLTYVAMSRCFCLLVIVTTQEWKRKYEEFSLELRE